MKTILRLKALLILFTLPLHPVFSQLSEKDATNYRVNTPLKIGDTLGNMQLEKLLNYKAEKSDLYSFKKKLLLIDFSETWCAPCVAALPKIDSLQKKFKDQVQVLVVSTESKRILTNFLKSFNAKWNITIPILAEDRALTQMFPHRTVPHEVWIDESGVVKAVTDAKDVTEANIVKFLSGNSINAVEKKDVMILVGSKIPLFEYVQNDSTQPYLYKSLLTPQLMGIMSQTGKGPYGPDKKRVSVINFTPLHLFHYAFGRYPLINYKRVVQDFVDSTKYYPPKDPGEKSGWYARNQYSYEIVGPANTPDSVLYFWMLQDLSKYFNIKAKVIKKTMPCWVLIRTDKSNNLLVSQGGESKFASAQGGRMLTKVQNKTLKEFATRLSAFMNIEPVLDETGYEGPVDLELNIQMSYNSVMDYFDKEEMRAKLKPYGLDLIFANRTVDVLYLTDKPDK